MIDSPEDSGGELLPKKQSVEDQKASERELQHDFAGGDQNPRACHQECAAGSAAGGRGKDTFLHGRLVPVLH